MASQSDSPDTLHSYVRYDQQVCDHCGDVLHVHEAKECTNSNGVPGYCTMCGHGNHRRNKCPFGLTNYRLGTDLRDEIIDFFTPWARGKIIAVRERKAKKAQTMSQTPSISGPSDTTADDEETKPAITLAQQKEQWTNELKNMPTPAITENLQAPTRKMRANVFKLNITKKRLCRYNIMLGEWFDAKPIVETVDGQEVLVKQRKIKPEVKKFMIKQLLAKHKPDHDNWATDYDSTIISVGELYINSAKTPGQVTSTHHPRTEDATKNLPLINSTIEYLGDVDTTRLLQYVDGKAPDYHPDADLKALNIISWKHIRDGNFQGGVHNSRFYPEGLLGQTQENDGSLYLIRTGFFSSVRPGRKCVLLNVNTATSAFFSPMKLSTWISGNWSSPEPTLGQFTDALKGIRVTCELGNSGRKWVIHGLSPKRTIGATTFQLRGSTQKLSVFKYLCDTYDGTEFVKNTLCVNVGGDGDDAIWYPADLLAIVGWQVVKKLLPEDYSTSMLDSARRKPAENRKLINDYALKWLGVKVPMEVTEVKGAKGAKGAKAVKEVTIVERPAPFYKNFGITPTTVMEEIPRTTLSAPALVYRRGDDLVKPEEGTWNVSRVSFNQPGHVRFLGVLLLCDPVTTDGITMLCEQLKARGLNYPGEKIVWDSKRVLKPNMDSSFRQDCQVNLGQGLRQLKSLEDRGPCILLVVLPDKGIDLYAEVKRWGDCVAGSATICITKEVLDAMTLNICGNLSLKFNAKRFGTNHILENVRIFGAKGDTAMLGTNLNTMIMGADCTHPRQSATDCPSIAGVVATTNDSWGAANYLASARLQPCRQEYISDLRGMVKERVRRWWDTHSGLGMARFPREIMFYRDGVSESQYGMVRYEELPQIRDGCKDVYNDVKVDKAANFPSTHRWDPTAIKIILIVVVKRHNVRFYPLNLERGLHDNVLPGSIADQVVVEPNYVNFYLQSHASPLGTGRSAHYVVLQNDLEKEYKLDRLQLITYRLCYLGPRATKALSVCIPACYADLLCNRLRCYLKPSLEDKFPARPIDAAGSKLDRPAAEQDWNYYVRDPYVWEQPVGRPGPWHQSMDDRMFYI